MSSLQKNVFIRSYKMCNFLIPLIYLTCIFVEMSCSLQYVFSKILNVYALVSNSGKLEASFERLSLRNGLSFIALHTFVPS